MIGPSSRPADRRTRSIRRPRVSRLIRDWAIVLPFAVVTGALLVGPAANIALDSIRDPKGGFTLGNWSDVFRLPLTQRAIVNSLVLSSIVATLCLVIGAPLAWSVSRLRVGGRSVAIAALNVSANLAATSLVFGFAAAFGGAGFVTLLLQKVWPEAPALDLYSNTGLVLVYLYFHLPLFVLLILPAVGVVSEQLWEAAAVCGARPRLFWRRVGLPVMAPFLIAGWFLMFVWSLGTYGVPLALGGAEGSMDLITLRIGSLVQSVGRTNRFQRAACLSLVLIALSIGSLWLYQRLLRRAARWQR